MNIQYNFFCEKENVRTRYHYNVQTNTFVINSFSSNGCVTHFYFLQYLHEVSYLTGIVFFLLGAVILFAGIKLYYNVFYALIPIFVAMLGFFMYFALIDKSGTPFQNFGILCGILLAITLSILIIIYANKYVFLITFFLVSFQLGLFVKAIAEEHISFFKTPETIWIFVIFFYLLFSHT